MYSNDISKTLIIGHNPGKTVTNIIFKISNDNLAQKYEIITMKRNPRKNIGAINIINQTGGSEVLELLVSLVASKYPRTIDTSSTISKCFYLIGLMIKM